MRTITKDEVLPVLINVIKENPDRQVEACTYRTSDRKPNCVVGYVFDRMGVPMPPVNDLMKNGDQVGHLNATFLVPHGFELDEGAESLLLKAQLIQDSAANDHDLNAEEGNPGRPWKDILEELDLEGQG